MSSESGASGLSAAVEPAAGATGRRPRRTVSSRVLGSTGVMLARAVIVVAVLLAWQYLPQVGWLRKRSPAFDPFFVSSPSRIFHRLVDLATGAPGQPDLWVNVWQTVEGTFLGVLIGTALGALAGLIFSNSQLTSRIFSPFIVMINATPRIALIPIFVIIFGPTLTASVVTAVVVVFFLVFYNAFNGGVSVPTQALQNARLLGASSYEVMRYVRLPYVMVWTFASLPNAISFGLVAVVTAEILMGTLGLGQLLNESIQLADSTLTFAVVVVLTLLGVTLVMVSGVAKRRILHWWSDSATTAR